MTTIQQQASRMTREALASLFSAARHMPDDKLDWIPMGEARSVQTLLYECALTTPFYIAAAQGNMHEFAALVPDEETQELWRRRSEASWTLEGVEAVARETFAELCQALEAIPDDALGKVQPHPMDPTKQVTTADLLFLAYWNLVYHTGQINYIHMMLGDVERRL
jgi:uncharacterized damage-inducible protein DinB